MTRYIDADALKLTGCRVTNNDGSTTIKAAVMEEDIDNAPTIDAEPVRHGKWLPLYNGEYKGGAYWFECSECKAVVTGGLQSGNRFCKGCGARMDKE
jgi:hypothetical protein